MLKFEFNKVKELEEINKRFSNEDSADYDNWDLMNEEEILITDAATGISDNLSVRFCEVTVIVSRPSLFSSTASSANAGLAISDNAKADIIASESLLRFIDILLPLIVIFAFYCS